MRASSTVSHQELDLLRQFKFLLLLLNVLRLVPDSPPTATVPGTPKPSSPLSTPEASPVVSKRATRSSKQAIKSGQMSDAESAARMANALERRKAIGEAKQAQAAAKKKNEQETTAREDELEREIKGPAEKQSKKSCKK
ncbi:hypothetical protein RhiJN_27058 [Ceratobasidium sp. AG-Ba]|nr:hypothetical protein RhiJN_27058 [Ceratobasidium sp. AG-Ba]